MRYLFKSFLFLFLWNVTVCAADAFNIHDVLLERLCRDDFPRHLRIPFKSRHFIYRTDPEQVSGPYFILFCNRPISYLPAKSYLELEFYENGESQCQRITVPIQAQSKASREIWIGLTDRKYRDFKIVDFLAWRLSIFTENGKLLASRKSFLFQSHPTKPQQEESEIPLSDNNNNPTANE